MSTASSLLHFVKKLAVADKNGELDGEPITEQVLAEIIMQMEKNVINVTLVNHDEDQREVDRGHQAIADCSTVMQEAFSDPTSGVNFLKNAMEANNNTHFTCRAAQAATNSTKEDKCSSYDVFAKSLDATKPNCACNLPASTSEEWFECMKTSETWFVDNTAAFGQHKDSCNTAINELDNQKQKCETDQTAFELAHCSYGQILISTCSTYEECHTKTEKNFGDTKKDVEASEAARKVEYTAAKHVICYVGVLNASADSKSAALAACENATYDTSVVHINYPDVPPALECDVTPVDDRPCTDGFISK